MEDNIQDVETNDVAENKTEKEFSLRASLKQQLRERSDDEEPTSSADDSAQEVGAESDQAPSPDVSTQAVIERPALVPPSDMNAAERDAYLNPTSANAHILQQYLNRRAYETRTQYDRKMQEVNQLKQQTSAVYDAISKYENEYAREGISLSDIATRSIAWDKAMKQDPVGTALEWLESYGVSVEDLTGYAHQYQQPYQPQAEYLTREDAERIAAEKLESIQQEQDKKALEMYNQRVVELFMNTKPLFKDPETAAQLEAEMAPVVQALNSTGRYSSAEQVLETAYNYVVNGNPAFSGIVQKMTTGPAVQKQQAITQKAKQAAKSISGSAGSGTPRIKSNSLRDNLERRFKGE